MPIDGHHNFQYNSAAPNPYPDNIGDRYYSQDIGRDFHFTWDKIGFVMRDYQGFGNFEITTPKVLPNFTIIQAPKFQQTAAGIVAKGTLIAYIGMPVRIPNNFSGIPPASSPQQVEGVRVEAPIDLLITETNAIGNAPIGTDFHILKCRFAVTELKNRTRSIIGGNYPYEIGFGFEYYIDNVEPLEDGSEIPVIGWEWSNGAPTFQYDNFAEYTRRAGVNDVHILQDRLQDAGDPDFGEKNNLLAQATGMHGSKYGTIDPNFSKGLYVPNEKGDGDKYTLIPRSDTSNPDGILVSPGGSAALVLPTYLDQRQMIGKVGREETIAIKVGVDGTAVVPPPGTNIFVNIDILDKNKTAVVETDFISVPEEILVRSPHSVYEIYYTPKHALTGYYRVRLQVNGTTIPLVFSTFSAEVDRVNPTSIGSMSVVGASDLTINPKGGPVRMLMFGSGGDFTPQVQALAAARIDIALTDSELFHPQGCVMLAMTKWQLPNGRTINWYRDNVATDDWWANGDDSIEITGGTMHLNQWMPVSYHDGSGVAHLNFDCDGGGTVEVWGYMMW